MGAGSVDGGGLAEGGLILLDLRGVAGGLEVPFTLGFETGAAERAEVEGGRS